MHASSPKSIVSAIALATIGLSLTACSTPGPRVVRVGHGPHVRPPAKHVVHTRHHRPARGVVVVTKPAPKVIVAKPAPKVVVVKTSTNTTYQTAKISTPTAVIVWIDNANGSRTPVELQPAANGGWQGPKGEVYQQIPTGNDLRSTYGLPQ